MSRIILPGLLAAALLAGAIPAGAARAADPDAQVANDAASRQAAAGLDTRIHDLRARLGITTAEEPAWDSFTAVMRQNMQDMNAKMAARKNGFASMSAVDDLRSYADISTARAEGVTRLVGPFSTLYDQLSPAQRKIADQVFRNNTNRAMRAHG